MSFSSFIGSGFIPENYGVIGVTLEGGVSIPLNTSNNPVTVINKDISGLKDGYYLITYTMVIKCLTNAITPALLSLQIQGQNYEYFNMLDEYDLQANERKEITITQIGFPFNGQFNINLTYKANVSLANTATYEFQGILAYEPIDLVFVPPPV
jgi:hypothetical protein